jgi:hypothetical protein
MEALALDWGRLIATVGPFGAVVVFMLWRCIQRQDAREDRMAEVIASNAAAMEKAHERADTGYTMAVENNKLLQRLAADAHDGD